MVTIYQTTCIYAETAIQTSHYPIEVDPGIARNEARKGKLLDTGNRRRGLINYAFYFLHRGGGDFWHIISEQRLKAVADH